MSTRPSSSSASCSPSSSSPCSPLALIEVRRRLHSTSQTLATLAGALEMVESEHLRTLEPSVKAINAQFDMILGALPGIAAKAAVVAERRPS